MKPAVELAKMSSDGFILEFPVWFRLVCGAFSTIGIAAWLILGSYMVQNIGNIRLSNLELVALMCLPIGAGFMIWSLQVVAVHQSQVVSHLLGFTKELDRSTCHIKSTRNNGYTLQDRTAATVFVSMWMRNSKRLAEECEDRGDLAG